MKGLSATTAIFCAFLASQALASEVTTTITEHEEKQANSQAKLYLRQNPFVDQNNVIATSDSDAADTSSAAASWLLEDEEEDVEMSQQTFINWSVSGCCGKSETIFLCCFAAYLVIIKLLWNSFIMKPMKLVAVFVHEFGHATACWMTGGKVHGIEVYKNEGGVTKYSGGVRWIVIPAGYLGGAFWGAAFVVFSGDRWASLTIAILFCVGMIASLFYAPNKTMVGLNIGFIALTVVFILVDLFSFSPFLQFLTLFCKCFLLNVLSVLWPNPNLILSSKFFSIRRRIHWNLFRL